MTPEVSDSSADTARDQQSLATALGAAYESIESLVRELRAQDAELEALAPERRQHRLVHDACDALDELGTLGGAPLFWGEPQAVAAGGELLRRVRDRVATFAQRVTELEARRQGTRERIDREQYRAGLIEDELFEVHSEEERRQHEWIVEREISGLHSKPLTMPWTWGGEADRRFQKSLLGALASCLLLALMVSLIRLPLQRPPEQVLAEQALHITMALPRPPPPRVLPPPPKPLVQKAVEKVTPQQSQKPPSEEPLQPAVEAAAPPKPAGLLAFKQQVAALADAKVNPAIGADAHIMSAEAAAGTPERAMLTSSAPGSSGGINLAAVSRGLGSGAGERTAIRGGTLTRAASGIGTGAAASRPVSGGPGPGRTDEEIQIVFDRHKAQLYRLYNLELRRDPTLQGKIILRLTIEPDGSVSLCQQQATNMNAPELSAQVVDRVRAFNFGAKVVPPITIVYPIDFLPAS